MMRNVHTYHEYRIFYKTHLDIDVLWNEFSISRLPYQDKCALFFDMSCYNFGVYVNVFWGKVVYIILKLCISYLTMLAALWSMSSCTKFVLSYSEHFDYLNVLKWCHNMKKKITVKSKFSCFQGKCNLMQRVDSKQDIVCKPIKTCACLSHRLCDLCIQNHVPILIFQTCNLSYIASVHMFIYWKMESYFLLCFHMLSNTYLVLKPFKCEKYSLSRATVYS